MISNKIIGESELILNSDGSIYHLNLLPSDIAHKIILVGDPDRVSLVSSFFDSIEIKKQKREFVTHTGTYNNERITVLSTGIGTDNIDIVLNELDALVNIDFTTRTANPKPIKLQIIRIGTSGAIQKDIDVDTFLVSEFAIGFDGLMHYYEEGIDESLNHFTTLFNQFLLDNDLAFTYPYMANASSTLIKKFDDLEKGITLTASGFYGPQGRMLRAKPKDVSYLDKMDKFRYQNMKITNLEMETAGIYGLSRILNHDAISLNLILANRLKKTFSNNYEAKMKELIKLTLDRITTP